ncbi:hypothetical protein HUU51_03030 [Candidatus Gracilibacteria bacterium]|nr:hypothetical protein [Candidatus Gracilibacteria bacterium]
MKKQLVTLGVVAGLSTPVLADNKALDTASSDIKDKVYQVVPTTSVSYLEWCAKNPDACKVVNESRGTYGTRQDLDNALNKFGFSKNNQATSFARTNNNGDLNLNGNSNVVGGVIKLDGQTIYLGLENISGTDVLVKAEYKYVGNDFGTLITVKSGNGHKSVFLTGKYNGVDYSIKSTAGYLEKDYKGANIGQAFLGVEGEKKLDDNYALGAHLSVTNTQTKELPGTRFTNSPSSVTNHDTYTVTDITEISKWQEFAGDKGRVNGGVFGQYISDDMRNKTRLGISGNNGTDKGYYGNASYSHITSDGKTRIGTEINTDKSFKLSFERFIGNTSATISAYIGKIAGKEVAGLGLSIPLDSKQNRFRHASPGLDKDVTHVTGAEKASSVLFGKEVAKQEIKTRQVIEAVPTEEVKNFNYTISGGIATFTFTARNGFRYYSVISGNDNLVSGNSFTVDVSVPGEYKVGIYELNPYDNSKGPVVYKTINIADNKPNVPTFSGSTSVVVGSPMNLTFSSSDPEGKPVTFRVVGGAIPSGTTFNSNGTLTGSTTTVQSGSFQVVSNDGSLDSDIVTVNYNVESVPVVNTAPTTPSLSGSTTVIVGSSMNLSFSSTDAEGNPITYSVVSGTIPAGTTFNSNGTLNGTTTTVQSGSFQVVASDGSLSSSPLTVTYNVESVPVVNTAPTTPTVSGNPNVTVGDSMNLSFSSTDAEGNPITYSVVSGTIPAGTTFNSNGTLSGTTTTSQSGSFQVVASDGTLSSSSVTVNYNVDALPPQSLSITTSGPVISGANTDSVTALNGPGDNIVFNISVNTPYTLSSSTITFTPNIGLQTQTVDILHNGNVVGTRTLSVTWQ